MMRLKLLYTKGNWKVLAPVNANGVCEVEDAINALKNSRKTKATGVGFVALWSRIPNHGPRELGTDKYHRVDEENAIYEFIKGGHRLLCFEADGALVVCSHIFKKSSGKTPKKETKRAVKLRDDYLAREKLGDIEIDTDVGG
jgi:hypothetical protein